jgi:hypothetical protein
MSYILLVIVLLREADRKQGTKALGGGGRDSLLISPLLRLHTQYMYSDRYE